MDEYEWEIPDYHFPDVDLLRGKNVVLYGAGKVGRSFYAQLVKYVQIHIVLWCDGHPENYSLPYCSISSVADIIKIDYDFIIVSVLKKETADEIISEISTMGIPLSKLIWLQPKKRLEAALARKVKKVGRNIVRFSGGLGNQMFQYAFYKSLNMHGMETEANISGYAREGERKFELLKVFPKLRMDIDAADDYDAYRNPLNRHVLFKEKEDSVFDREVFKQRDVSFGGYWQSEKYFTDIEKDLRKDFVFDAEDTALKKFADTLIAMKGSVSIHVRRGDYYTTNANADLYGNICTVDYYERAVSYMTCKLHNPHFIVFSDDLVWAKDNLCIPDAVFVSPDMFHVYRDWYDMFLMSCCKHNIIANSSFSWWGAWLNKNPGKIVVAPSKWLNDKTTPDIWCDGWVKV